MPNIISQVHGQLNKNMDRYEKNKTQDETRNRELDEQEEKLCHTWGDLT